MSEPVHLAGWVVGSLKVVEDVGPSRNGARKWLCICICGKEVVRPAGNLLEAERIGTNSSCGCQRGTEEGRTKRAAERLGKIVGYIYLIQCGATSFYKLGYTKNILHRICNLQMGNPHKLHLVLKQRGGWKEEKAVHKKFKPYLVRGEWYKFSPKLLSEVKKYIRDGTIEVS